MITNAIPFINIVALYLVLINHHHIYIYIYIYIYFFFFYMICKIFYTCFNIHAANLEISIYACKNAPDSSAI